MLAGVMEGAAFRFRVQTPESVTAWGTLIGESVLETTARMQTPEVLALVRDTAERAMDTREVQRIEVPFRQGLGSILWVPSEGSLFSKWDWVTAPTPALTERAWLRLAAEHLEASMWAVRTGRPLPHEPAAFRSAMPPYLRGPGATDAPSGSHPRDRR